MKPEVGYPSEGSQKLNCIFHCEGRNNQSDALPRDESNNEKYIPVPLTRLQ